MRSTLVIVARAPDELIRMDAPANSVSIMDNVWNIAFILTISLSTSAYVFPSAFCLRVNPAPIGPLTNLGDWMKGAITPPIRLIKKLVVSSWSLRKNIFFSSSLLLAISLSTRNADITDVSVNSPSVFSLDSLSTKSEPSLNPCKNAIMPDAVSALVFDKKCLLASAKSIPPPLLIIVELPPPAPIATVAPVG